VVSVHGAHLRKQATEETRLLAANVAPSDPAQDYAIRSQKMTLAEQKRALRREAKVRRARVHERLASTAGARVRDRFIESISVQPIAVVSGYWPFGSELDIRPLMTHLRDCGHVCALPAVTAPDAPLTFHVWSPGDRLQSGSLGEPTPDPATEIVEPDVLLVPLLAFDRQGYRLGYGGGYYDRTLRGLRTKREILAVGVAYADQEVDAVFHGDTDEPLDWVITDRAAISVRTTATAQ